MDNEQKTDIHTTMERQYYATGTAFVKRSLAPHEFRTTKRGNVHIPFHNKERLQNEADCLKFIQENTDIPVPECLGFYNDEGAWYLRTSFVEGITLSHLPDEDRATIMIEVQKHITTLRSLESQIPGGPGGILCPPGFVTNGCNKSTTWQASSANNEIFRFCHCDLSSTNIFVDPVSLKITAIIDWEYSGFYPAAHEIPYYQRATPSGGQGKHFIKEREQIREFWNGLKLEPISCTVELMPPG